MLFSCEDRRAALWDLLAAFQRQTLPAAARAQHRPHCGECLLHRHLDAHVIVFPNTCLELAVLTAPVTHPWQYMIDSLDSCAQRACKACVRCIHCVHACFLTSRMLE